MLLPPSARLRQAQNNFRGPLQKAGREAPRVLEWFLGPPGPPRPPKSMISGSRKKYDFMIILIRSWGYKRTSPGASRHCLCCSDSWRSPGGGSERGSHERGPRPVPGPLRRAQHNVVAIKPRNKNCNLRFGLSGHFPAKLGPETRSNGSGSEYGAEFT